MTHHSFRPFRFGIHLVNPLTTRADWVARAQKAESLGYDIVYVPDHFTSHLGYGPALATAAAATTTLRIGTFVLDNDFRHPAIVAAEAGMLDLLSDGRFELGIGAGWLRADYDRSGIPFDAGATRFGRLTESVRIIKGLLAGETVAFAGEHYTITDLRGVVQPVQRPHPPLLIGGGRQRLLTFAAQEANIISIIARSLPNGGLDETDQTIDEKIGWIRQAAGARMDDLELNTLIQRIIVTDDVPGEAAALATQWGSTAEAMRGSPYVLIGSIDAISETLRERRARYGISYISMFERDMDAFAPVVARLAAT